jgi:hypothetical protein
MPAVEMHVRARNALWFIGVQALVAEIRYRSQISATLSLISRARPRAPLMLATLDTPSRHLKYNLVFFRALKLDVNKEHFSPNPHSSSDIRLFIVLTVASLRKSSDTRSCIYK